jgi:hypothetical protein
MRRREFIALAGASVAWPFAAIAQQAGRTYRLGSLLPLARNANHSSVLMSHPPRPINVAFFEELRHRGFIEGQYLTVEYRAYGLHADLISQYAAELVQAHAAKASGAEGFNFSAPPLFFTYGQLIMERVAALRRLCRLWTAPESALRRGNDPTARQAVLRHQGRRHPSRAADQVRIGDQPQDR